eukprot:179123_1
MDAHQGSLTVVTQQNNFKNNVFDVDGKKQRAIKLLHDAVDKSLFIIPSVSVSMSDGAFMNVITKLRDQNIIGHTVWQTIKDVWHSRKRLKRSHSETESDKDDVDNRYPLKKQKVDPFSADQLDDLWMKAQQAILNPYSRSSLNHQQLHGATATALPNHQQLSQFAMNGLPDWNHNVPPSVHVAPAHNQVSPFRIVNVPQVAFTGATNRVQSTDLKAQLQFGQSANVIASNVPTATHVVPSISCDVQLEPTMPLIEPVKVWLEKVVRLPQYYPLLEENGFEEWGALVELKRDVMKDIGIEKIGHRLKLEKMINKIRQSGLHE